jgi:hypothetical protein
MDGFGAYDLARLDAGGFCAIGGGSPSLWHAGGEPPAGTLADAEDFERHDVTRHRPLLSRPYPGASLWLDVGSEDRFVEPTRTSPRT